MANIVSLEWKQHDIQLYVFITTEVRLLINNYRMPGLWISSIDWMMQIVFSIFSVSQMSEMRWYTFSRIPVNLKLLAAKCRTLGERRLL
jgi:hypothetical protein